MSKIDESYEPQLWKCKNPECELVLGLVVRDANRAYHLNVFRHPVISPSLFKPYESDHILYAVQNLDQGDVLCAGCKQVRTWDAGKEALQQMLKRIHDRRANNDSAS